MVSIRDSLPNSIINCHKKDGSTVAVFSNDSSSHSTQNVRSPPAHTRHLLQTLDFDVYHPHKAAWAESLHFDMKNYPNDKSNRISIDSIYNLACISSLSYNNITAGFRKAGNNTIQPG